MKATVFISFIFLSFLTFGQVIERGVDSAANKEWVVRPWKTLSGIECLIRYESVLRKKPRIVVLACGDSSVLASSLTIKVKECTDIYNTTLKKTKDRKKAEKLCLACEEKYFKNPVNADKTDTLWIEKGSYAFDQLKSCLSCQLYTTSEIVYDSLGTFSSGVFYYTMDELKHSCISKELRLKRLESWENGQKHGKWRYYDLTGEIICEEKYSNGILIESTCK